MNILRRSAHPFNEVMSMKQPKPFRTQDSRRPWNSDDIPKDISDNLHISPEKRICPSYDYHSIAAYRVGDPEQMGFRVVDNAVHEHIM